ncbi:MAG TPA: NYN domain-containing protein, partial [Candidatus Latescibacteria bacterium]|nr:NYN domain-containing protein [Candidatus Latescibacterota bacterium]
QAQFQQILTRIGFEVKLMPYIERADGSAKGDWDVGITLDMLEYADRVDVVVLASGDGDYTLAIDKLIDELAVSVEVYGVPRLSANRLIESATRFVPIQGGLLLPIPTTW